jgi:PTS system glucose-specific IIA component
MSLLDKLQKAVVVSDDESYNNEIFAPLSGQIILIEDVPDVVIAEKIIGDGIAIKPTSHKIVAPFDGTIALILDTKYAFSIESDTGIELLIQFGIDCGELNGEGFRRIATEGQKVTVGDTIIEVDLDFFEQKNKSTLTSVVISSMDKIKGLIKMSGDVTEGESVVMRVMI